MRGARKMGNELNHIADLLERVEVHGQQNLTLLLACINSLRSMAARAPEGED